ncbi:probable protein S-acyltransferase 7 isoform X2 [Durio zibethinus]|uniref:S-acyltransferase n=1 Tax=Durio zibethinus TaxID=66656 RepID=A0A6P5YCN2_DURZI|nr:probable protein S-acyltransferase 7 isoform X2 [Durio zibethinus]
MNGLQPPSPDLANEANHAPDGFIRTYKAWKGSNVFVLGGRLIFGPDVRSLFFTIFLIAAPVAVFCVFVARKLMDDFPHHLGISIMDIILLLLTSGRDPGIIPRSSHPPEPEGYEGITEVRPGQTPPLRFPRTKDVVINGISVKIKYCDTCMLYRPPRCSHCSICKNCVDRFDHHCPWVGQCIGLRNYRFFFMFVFFTTLLCLYVHGFCWVYIRRIMDGEETTIWKAMIKTPASIVLVIYTFISVWFVGGLTVFHLYLISTNQSTYENFRCQYDRRDNPFNKGVIENFMEIFCTGIPPSKTNFRAKIPKEPAISPRTVRGGFISPNKGKAIGDIEMGRKPVWDEALGEIGDDEGQLSGDSTDKDSRLPDVSLHLSRILPLENTEGHGVMHHPRRSSWGRNSERWDISPGILPLSRVGESKRMNGRNNAESTNGNQQFETKL